MLLVSTTESDIRRKYSVNYLALGQRADEGTCLDLFIDFANVLASNKDLRSSLCGVLWSTAMDTFEVGFFQVIRVDEYQAADSRSSKNLDRGGTRSSRSDNRNRGPAKAVRRLRSERRTESFSAGDR